MDQITIMKGILDSYPYPIVFADKDFIIHFLNRCAEYHYYKERGYGPLLGCSLLDCHEEATRNVMQKAFQQMQKDGKEVFIGVNARNLRMYMQGVRDREGQLIGFIERFELNWQK